MPARLLLLVLALFGCVSTAHPYFGPHATGVVTGRVAYRERVALPPDATIRVRLADVSLADAPARVLAETLFVAGGRQVPFAFRLWYRPSEINARSRYAVRAEIRMPDGTLGWTTDTHTPVLTHGGTTTADFVLVRVHAAGQTTLGLGPAQERSLRIHCADGRSWTARASEDALMLDLANGGTLRLPRVVAASGEKYEVGESRVWVNGAEALVTLDGARSTGCRVESASNPWADAGARGVTFRAVGNEPGWTLEIGTDRMTLIWAYGERAATLPAMPPVVTDGMTRYTARAESHAVNVTVRKAPCSDGMSDAVYPFAVVVVVDGETLSGCGRKL